MLRIENSDLCTDFNIHVYNGLRVKIRVRGNAEGPEAKNLNFMV